MREKFRRMAPAMLTLVSVTGMVTTSVLSAKAYVKALDLIESVEDTSVQPLTNKEKIVITLPLYKAAIASGVATGMCMVGIGFLNKTSQASMVSSYALLNQSYSKYRDKIVELYGREVDDKVMSEILVEDSESMVVYSPGYQIYDTNPDDESDRRLFFDSFSQRYFESSMPAVLNAQYHINRNFALGGDVTVNSFYEFLGIKPIKNGDEIGWWSEDLYDSGIAWIDFDNRRVVMDDDLECYIITSMIEPGVIVDSRDQEYH